MVPIQPTRMLSWGLVNLTQVVVGGFCGSKIINPHLPMAMPPDRGTLSAVGRNEAKLYRETRGRQRFGSGVVGPEEIWILKFGDQQHPSYLIT